MQPPNALYSVHRRVAGYHDQRMDGMVDLVMRSRGCSIFDVGCNRGLVGFEFANNGAAVVHGCDNYEIGIQTARELFADLRSVPARFEVVDLTGGPAALAVFGGQDYDITVMLATYHKLKRIMSSDDLTALMRYLGKHTKAYFAWRATSDKPGENEAEMDQIDLDFRSVGLKRIHTSTISDELGIAAVWRKQV